MNIKHKPKITDGISFVVPAFNCEKTIAESIYSIVDKNFEPRDEIIIVNDGSTDKTLHTIKKIQKKYPFIITVNNFKNKGCPASRNIGIRKAKNELIFNLDSDDILVPGSVNKLKKYLISNNADVAAFAEIHFFTNSIKNITHKWICKSGLFTLADFLAGPVVPGGNFIYTKSSWKRIGGYWEYGRGLHEFWGFELKQIASGSKFVNMANSYYYHRHSHDSLYEREIKDENQSSLITTRMIKPYLHLLHPEDAKYIKGDIGSKMWFKMFSSHPLRLKNGKLGKTGRVKNLKITKKRKILSKIGRMSAYLISILEYLKVKYLRIKPVSRFFGFDRGLPIDRYYIEKFLSENSQFIKGVVLEIAELTYTRKFGGGKVKKSLIFNIKENWSGADILGNLATGEGVKENLVDCFIMTQTLPFIYDVSSAVKNAVKILKPGGSLLVTVPGITQISRYDMSRWGQYWSFTNLSLRKLFEEVVPPSCITIKTYGNVKSSACFLYGFAQHELTRKELEYQDLDYQLVIGAVIKKPEQIDENK